MSKILEKIFSIKNEDTKKVLRILGVKIKFKSNSLVTKKTINILTNNIRALNEENFKLKKQLEKTDKKYEKEVTMLKEKHKNEIQKNSKIFEKTEKKYNIILNIIKEYKDLISEGDYFLLLNRGFSLNDKKIQIRNQINLKTQQNEYKLKENPCLCGAHRDKLLSVRDRYGIKINTVICENCGLIRTNPYYDEESLNNFYNSEYRSLYTFTNDDTEKFFEQQIRAGKKILDNVVQNTEFLPKDEIVYEIGTGMGGILSVFKDAGSKIKGVDIGENYIKLGKQKGLDLEVGSIDVLKKYEQADLLILNHVIEHILNPIEFLKDMRDVIKEDGLLYVAVPTIETIPANYKNNFFRYIQNAHVYNFSQHTLTYIIECAGYTPVAHIDNFGAIICKKTDKYREQNDVDKNHYNYEMSILKKFEKDFEKENNLYD